MNYFKFFALMFVFLNICFLSLAEDSSDQKIARISQDIQSLTRSVEQLKNMVEDQQRKIDALEKENEDLKSRLETDKEATPMRPEELTETTATITTSEIEPRRPVTGLQAFNPEIGMVADIVAKLTQNKADEEGNDKISVRELELVIGHDIDPYARFDSTIALSDFEDLHLEEAYITYWGLPWDIKGRLGRMRPKIGKVTTIHPDSMETVDEPLVVQNYLGEEGLFRTGLELSCFVPSLSDMLTQELTIGVMEGGIGHGGTLFGGERRQPSVYAHLKNFWDVSDMTNAELGATFLTGSGSGEEDFDVKALGLDLTLIHYFDPIRRLKLQNEFYFQFRDYPPAADSGDHDHGEEEALEDDHEHEENYMSTGEYDLNPWGYYVLADYRLCERFSLGARWDWVIPSLSLEDSSDADWAASGYFTFHQSEFFRWRIQYEHIEYAEGDDDNRVFLQGTIAIGVHKHQLQ